MRVALALAAVLFAAAPASAQNFATYRCADGTVIPVEFFDAPRSASVQIDGKSIILSRKLFSVSGARYAKGGTNLRIARDKITLKRKGQRYVTCTAQ